MSHHHRVLVELQEAAKNGIKGIGFSGGIHQVDRIRDAIHSAEMMAYRYFTYGRVRLTVEADGLAGESSFHQKTGRSHREMMVSAFRTAWTSWGLYLLTGN